MPLEEECASTGAALRRRNFAGKQTVRLHDILRSSLVQPGVVGLPQRRVGLAIEEGEEGIAPPARYWRDLMQRAAGEHHGAAMRRAIAAAAELRKDEIAAVIVPVEVDGDGEAPVLRADIDVVAMAMEMAADGAVVAGDDIAVHARRLELEILRDGRDEPAHDLAADRLAQLGVGDDEIVAALEPVIDDPRGLAFDVEQKAGIAAAELFVELDEHVAQRKIE